MALEPQINMSAVDDAALVLLTVEAADGSGISYFVNNNEDIVSRGITFMAYAFEIVLPDDTSDETSMVQLAIDNVDRRITDFLRQLLEPPKFKLEIIWSSQPDVVERTVDFLTLRDVEYDAMTVSGKLVPMDPLSLPAVDSIYSGIEFPDLVYT